MSDPAPAAAGREALTPTLRVWRTRALYALLTVITVAGLPAYVAPVINARASGTITPILWAYLGIYVAFVALALAPSLPESTRVRPHGPRLRKRHRQPRRLGLAGSGRLYLLVMPVVAALLLGVPRRLHLGRHQPGDLRRLHLPGGVGPTRLHAHPEAQSHQPRGLVGSGPRLHGFPAGPGRAGRAVCRAPCPGARLAAAHVGRARHHRPHVT